MHSDIATDHGICTVVLIRSVTEIVMAISICEFDTNGTLLLQVLRLILREKSFNFLDLEREGE